MEVGEEETGSVKLAAFQATFNVFVSRPHILKRTSERYMHSVIM
jgi:hypothetical protein